MKTALILGITGQDGSYLAELLLSKNYQVYGMIRRNSSYNLSRIEKIKDKLILKYGDMTDGDSIFKLLLEIKPDEIYNFAAQSDVKVSFDVPEYSGNVNAIGTLRLLEAIQAVCPKARLYNACTSELYGNSTDKIQTITTPFNPVSPYGVAKQYSFNICEVYKKAYGLYIVNGICFNHESPRRGLEFVTEKICHNLVKYHYVELGNIEATRDWGYAKDYVDGIWLSLQQSQPDNYIFATGEEHSVKDFCNEVLDLLHIKYYWHDFYCLDEAGELLVVSYNKDSIRPIDLTHLCGDYSETTKKLGWEPKTKFKELVRIMVEAELYGEK